MALILTCGKCNKRMGTLDPYVVIGNKYLCKPCGQEKKEEAAVEEFYENLEVGDIPWIGFWKKEEYSLFVKKGFQFKNSIPVINPPNQSQADQFVRDPYLLIAYAESWVIYDNVIHKKEIEAYPHSSNGFNAYNPRYIDLMLRRF